MGKRFAFSILGFVLAVSSQAWAGAAITYHGRILDPDGKPVEQTQVHFKIQVRSPGTNNCLLYEEERTVNMAGSDGIFVIPIADGSANRTSGDPGITIENAFSNDGALNFSGLTCNSGSGYRPQALDARRLVVSFDDGSGRGSQNLPPMDVNYVPFSIHSLQTQNALNIGSIPASQVMSVSDGNATPLTSANFAELIALASGTSVLYLKSSSLPGCSPGEVLKATGGNFICVTDATGADTLAGMSCADGKILKRVSGSWACADESGVGIESDPTVQSFAKNSPAAGLVVDGSSKIAPDFGSAAGKIAQGNDPRFTDARAPNGSATGDLSGSYPNPTVKAIHGNAVAATTPQDGQFYKWNNGAAQFEPAYVGAADLKKANGAPQLPVTCAVNETLSWSSIGDAFTCVAIGTLDASKITSGTFDLARLPADAVALACADGKIPKRVSGAWACANESVGSETDPSVQAYAKNAPATGLIVNGSNKIAPDFGAGAGKIVEGNDSRLSDSRLASDIAGIASTGIIQRTGAGAFAALGTTAPIDVTAGTIGLSLGSGLSISSNALVPDFGAVAGKVAQGNDPRFPSSSCSSGGFMRWTGSAWVCETDSTTDSTKVAKGGDTMTGTLNLPANGLVLGTNQLVASGGNVGIGTDSPGQKLSVAGTIESTVGGIRFPDGTTQTTASSGGSGGLIWVTQTQTAESTTTASSFATMPNIAAATLAVSHADIVVVKLTCDLKNSTTWATNLRAALAGVTVSPVYADGDGSGAFLSTSVAGTTYATARSTGIVAINSAGTLSATLQFYRDAGTGYANNCTVGLAKLGSSSAASLWALNGSSLNYASGNVGIGTTVPSSLLQVNGEAQVGSSGAACSATTAGAIRYSGGNLQFCNSSAWTSVDTGGGSSQWTTSGSNIYYSTGNVGIGTTATSSKLTLSTNTGALPAPPTGTALQIGTADSSNASMTIDAFGATPLIHMRHSAGTAASPSATQLNDGLGGIYATGYGASVYLTNSAAKIQAYAGENWTDATGSAYLAFSTRPSGTTASASERMRIDPNGNVGIGTTTPGQKLSVSGTIESTSGGIKFPDGTTQITAASGGGYQTGMWCGARTVSSCDGSGNPIYSVNILCNGATVGTTTCSGYLNPDYGVMTYTPSGSWSSSCPAGYTRVVAGSTVACVKN